MTHASDLDIIYLFTGNFDAQSDGKRPLGATLYFNRLASRVSAGLSVPTAQGALYEVDTRLRPQGNQGPLAVSVEAFAKYQQESAWTWEHMALARARVLTASPKARVEVEEIIRRVLRQERDPKELRNAVLEMRGEMAKHKPARGKLDVKLLRGGLVDVEFLVHYLQLRDASDLEVQALSPRLSDAIAELASAQLIKPAMSEAHALMTNLLVAGRLLCPDGGEPPPAAAKALARACHCDSYAQLLQRLDSSRGIVAQEWARILEQELELD